MTALLRKAAQLVSRVHLNEEETLGIRSINFPCMTLCIGRQILVKSLISFIISSKSRQLIHYLIVEYQKTWFGQRGPTKKITTKTLLPPRFAVTKAFSAM